MKIALVQYNAWLGDLEKNISSMMSMYNKALNNGADVIVFPELALCGYPPEDLLLKPHFLEDNMAAINKIAQMCKKACIIVGFPEFYNNNCYNSLAVIENGKIQKIYRKTKLPNYGVFDEYRYFTPGKEPISYSVKGIEMAFTICEDIWEPDWLEEFTSHMPDKDIIINISASPFNRGKIGQRKEILAHSAIKLNCPIAYCNLVGGQDELVFDGRSMFVDTKGNVINKAKAFEEDIIYAELESPENAKTNFTSQTTKAPQPADTVEETWHALVVGTRDYVKKNGFKKIIIGLSGGIDSALVAAIAVKALGKENVIGVTMPTRFNTTETIDDAELLAKNLDIEFHTVPISNILETFDTTLNIIPDWDKDGTAFENLQARIRGTILMSISNKLGYMVLTTGNKSETAVGYSTLYGDTAGGFAVIKDIPKTMVYRLSYFVNKFYNKELIPVSTITRPPSAELRDNQKDSDSLPDYHLLDNILSQYVEQDKSADQVVQSGLPIDEVNRVIRLVDLNEYKRRQSPPGLKTTPKAFGRDRRLPITNRYRTTARKAD